MKSAPTILLLLCLCLPALAEPASFFVSERKAFHTAVTNARSWGTLYPLLSKRSTKEMKSLSAKERKEKLESLKKKTAMFLANRSSSPNLKVKGTKAKLMQSSKGKSVSKSGGATITSNVTTVDTGYFIKEGGRWKIDLAGFSL